MENTVAQRQPKKTDNNANKTEYYVSLSIAIVIGIIGVFIRFVPDVIPSLDQSASLFSWIANILLLLASIMACRVVFGILGFAKK